jgi:hypothetical protein
MNNELQALQSVQNNQVYIPSENDWKFMISWGQTALKSGMLPESIRTPEAAAIIILKGRELGLSFMTAMAHIHVIKGKPSMSAELMQAMARKNVPGLKIVIIESSSEKAIVKFLRPETGSEWFTLTFSMDDARKAELLSNPSWKKYPRAMLWSRAIAAGLRTICPEALMGISYTPEELGAHVNEQGDVIETSSRPIPPVASVTPIGQNDHAKHILIKELNALMKEKSTSVEAVKNFISQFGKDKALDLTEGEIIMTIDWIHGMGELTTQLAAEPEVPKETPPWEREAQQDPRIVK